MNQVPELLVDIDRGAEATSMSLNLRRADVADGESAAGSEWYACCVTTLKDFLAEKLACSKLHSASQFESIHLFQLTRLQDVLDQVC